MVIIGIQSIRISNYSLNLFLFWLHTNQFYFSINFKDYKMEEGKKDDTPLTIPAFKASANGRSSRILISLAVSNPSVGFVPISGQENREKR